jgi:hypothetical protein
VSVAAAAALVGVVLVVAVAAPEGQPITVAAALVVILAIVERVSTRRRYSGSTLPTRVLVDPAPPGVGHAALAVHVDDRRAGDVDVEVVCGALVKVAARLVPHHRVGVHDEARGVALVPHVLDILLEEVLLARRSVRPERERVRVEGVVAVPLLRL